jgi:hypothetical protein
MYYYLIQNIIIKSPIQLNYLELHDLPISEDKYLSQFDIFKYSDKIRFATEYNEDATPINNLYLYHHDILYQIIKRLNLTYPYIDEINENKAVVQNDYWNVYNCECRYNNINAKITNDDIKSLISNSNLNLNNDIDIINKLNLAFRGVDWDWNFNDNHRIYDKTVFCNDINQFFNRDCENVKFNCYNYDDLVYPDKFKDIWDFIPYVYPINGELTDLVKISDEEFESCYKKIRKLRYNKICKYDKYSLSIINLDKANKTIEIKLDKFDENRILINKLRKLLNNNGNVYNPKRYYDENNKFDVKLHKFIEEHTKLSDDEIYKYIYSNGLYDCDNYKYQILKKDFDIKLLEDYTEPSKLKIINELKEIFYKCSFIYIYDENDEDLINDYFYKFQSLDIDDNDKVEEFKNKFNKFVISDKYFKEFDYISKILNNLDKYEAMVVMADFLNIKFNDYSIDKIDDVIAKLKNIELSRKPDDDFYKVFIKDDCVKPKQYYEKINDNYINLKSQFNKNDVLIVDKLRFETYKDKNFKYCYTNRNIYCKGSIFNWNSESENMEDNYYYPYGITFNSNSNSNLKNKNKYLNDIIFNSSLLMLSLEKEYSAEEIYEFKPHLNEDELKLLENIKTPYDYANFIYKSIMRLNLQIPYNFNPFIYLQCNEALDLIEYISGYKVFKHIN